MGIVAVSITKSVNWRGKTEQFSNILHYDVGPMVGYTAQGWLDMIDAVAAAEKAAFGSIVSFVSGRVWGDVLQPPQDTVTLGLKDLTGTGTQPGAAEVPFELAVVVQKYIGRSPIFQRKLFLRKYLHICRGSSTAAAGSLLGNTTLGANEKNIGVDYGGRVQLINVGAASHKLCSPKGIPHDAVAGQSWVSLNHLHTRQFRQ